MTRARRRWITRGRLLVLAVIAVVGLVVAIIIGYSHDSRTDGAPVMSPIGLPATPPCDTDGHSEQGAAQTAAVGLAQVGQAWLGKPADLDRYVDPAMRPKLREAIAHYPSTLKSVTSTPVAWQPLAYTSSTATIRLLTRDVAVDAAGSTLNASAVTDARLTWDAAQGWWRLADWPTNPDVSLATELAATGRTFCETA